MSYRAVEAARKAIKDRAGADLSELLEAFERVVREDVLDNLAPDSYGYCQICMRSDES